MHPTAREYIWPTKTSIDNPGNIKSHQLRAGVTYVLYGTGLRHFLRSLLNKRPRIYGIVLRYSMISRFKGLSFGTKSLKDVYFPLSPDL